MDQVLLGIFTFFTDFGFILKIFVLIAIIGFLNQHMQVAALKVIVFMLMAYFILIANWGLFGTIWVIYAVLGLGVSSVLVDSFFVGMQGGHEQAGQPGEDPHKPHIGAGKMPPMMRGPH